MKTLTRKDMRRRGAALATVMIIILIMSVVLAATAKMGSQRAFTAKRLAEFARAQAIAEAGAHKAYSILATNFAQRTNDALFPLTSFADGTYDVTIKCFTNTEYQVLIISTGTYGQAVVDVVLDSTKEYTPPTTNETLESLVGYGVLAGGTIGFGGGLDTTGALMHANGRIDLNGTVGANSKVTSCVGIYGNGNVYVYWSKAPVISLHKHATPPNENIGAVPVVTIPQIDLTPYYLEAKKNGQVYTNSFPNATNVPGGIVWVEGNASVAGNVHLTMCIIATGDIDITGNGSITKYGKYPVLVSRDGSIVMRGGKKITGVMYARTGNITKTGNDLLLGSVIAKGNISGNGGWSGIFNMQETPTPPNVDTNADRQVVYVAAWQK